MAARTPQSAAFGRAPGNNIGPCASIPDSRLPQRTAPRQHSSTAILVFFVRGLPATPHTVLTLAPKVQASSSYLGCRYRLGLSTYGARCSRVQRSQVTTGTRYSRCSSTSGAKHRSTLGTEGTGRQLEALICQKMVRNGLKTLPVRLSSSYHGSRGCYSVMLTSYRHKIGKSTHKFALPCVDREAPQVLGA